MQVGLFIETEGSKKLRWTNKCISDSKTYLHWEALTRDMQICSMSHNHLSTQQSA